MGKLNLFRIGQRGVNVVANPLHLGPDELIKAQNAEVTPLGGDYALDQRPGMTAINSSVLSGGAVVAAFDCPVKAITEFTSYLYAGMVAGATNNWRRSTDGATWAGVNSPGKPTGNYTGVTFAKDFPRCVTVNNRLYFPDASSPIQIYEWDGTNARSLGAIPTNRKTGDAVVGVMDMITDGVWIYIATLDNIATEPDLVGRIIRLHPKTGKWEQVGPYFAITSQNGCPSALCFYQGLLWYGTYIGDTSGAGMTANIGYINVYGDIGPDTLDVTDAGTSDKTTAQDNGNITCMAVYKGRLYAGTQSLVAGTAAIVLERTENGVWSTTKTAGATTVLNGFTSMWVAHGLLFAAWADPGTTVATVFSFDGSSWSSDKTFANTDVVGQAVTFGVDPATSDVYVALGKTGLAGNTTSAIQKRVLAGTWSSVDDPADNFRGPIGVLRA